MSNQRVWAAMACSCLVAFFLFGLASVSAHHNQAGFVDEGEEITLEGTVVEFRWRNPHVLVFWEVEGENGEAVRWAGELGSVNTCIAAGLTKTSLVPGDKITVSARPSRSGTPVALISHMVKDDGTVLSGD
jgi:hypothetical protein